MKVLVVYKKTLFELVKTDSRSRKYFRDNQRCHKDLKRRHEAHKETLDVVINALKSQHITYDVKYRGDIKSQKHTKGYDLIITVGGDGTLLDTAHHVEGIPMLGVNSDPEKSVGFYCIANAETIFSYLLHLDEKPITHFPRAKVVLDGKQLPEPVFNDVLISHVSPAGMTVLDVTIEGNEYLLRKSSGLLICTSGGSTGWMFQEGGDIMILDDTRLQVRELGRKKRVSGYSDEVIVYSHTHDGELYIDGDYVKYPVKLCSSIEISYYDTLHIYGDFTAKRKLLSRQ